MITQQYFCLYRWIRYPSRISLLCQHLGPALWSAVLGRPQDFQTRQVPGRQPQTTRAKAPKLAALLGWSSHLPGRVSGQLWTASGCRDSAAAVHFLVFRRWKASGAEKYGLWPADDCTGQFYYQRSSQKLIMWILVISREKNNPDWPWQPILCVLLYELWPNPALCQSKDQHWTGK